jgi:hypothetical protein
MTGKMIGIVAMCACAAGSALGQGPRAPQFKVERTMELADVVSHFSVGFCLLTAPPRQYVAYYDSDRHMTVAVRDLNSEQWVKAVLPSRVGWDSHNYITMAVDADGHLHVSGNMHVDPLVYFRTERAGDVTSLQPRPMTGRQESRATYPKFMTDHRGALLFEYRDGGSGDGVTILNRYDPRTRTWSRLLDQPLLDGERQRNAYPHGPVRGPDGWFHMAWVWRDTPDCATNHHLSYARSRDMVQWESAFGQRLPLPIRLQTSATWVDPIPPGGGIINGCQRLFFDAENRPIVTYHKSDENGHMQIHAARAEGGRWVRRRLTDWRTPIRFSGRGTMGFIGIRISGLERVEPGVLTMTYHHREHGHGRLFVDEETLRPVQRRIAIRPRHPPELERVHSDFKGMGIRRATDLGSSGDAKVRYLLQWESLGSNHDRPRNPPLPAPSRLRLIKLVATDAPAR